MHNADSGSFSYENPRTIHWGAGCLAQRLDQQLKRRDLQRAFILTTRSVAANPALAPRLQALLGNRFVGQFSGIAQHAPAATVAEATRLAAAFKPDVLISIGGGSPIDATKAMAFALATGLDLSDPHAADQARAFSPRLDDLLPHLAPGNHPLPIRWRSRRCD